MAAVKKLIHKHWLRATEQLGEHESAAPGELEHCSLFSSLPPASAARFVVTDELEHLSTGTTTVFQRTGRLLTGEHALVWYELLRRCLLQPMPDGPCARIVVTYSEGELLRALKKKVDRKNRQDLRKRIDLLCDVSVRVVPVRGEDFHDSLLARETVSADSDAKHAVAIPAKLATLFARNYSIVNMNERLALKNPLARWLHAHYGPYKACFSSTLEHLRDVSGRGELRDNSKKRRIVRPAQRLPQFVEALGAAGNELEQVLGWSSWIAGGKFYVQKQPKAAAPESAEKQSGQSTKPKGAVVMVEQPPLVEALAEYPAAKIPVARATRTWVQQMTRHDLVGLLWALQVPPLTSDTLDKMQGIAMRAMADNGLSVEKAKAMLAEHLAGSDI